MNIEDFYLYTDAVIKQYVLPTALKEGYQIGCEGIGCSRCCGEPLHVFESEVDYILTKLSPEQIGDLTLRLEEWYAVAEREIATLNPTDYTLPKVWDYRSAGFPTCVFLVDNKCSIYEHRPSGCRVHFSLGPKKWCEPENVKNRSTLVALNWTADIIRQHVTHEVEHNGIMTADLLPMILCKKVLGKSLPTSVYTEMTIRDGKMHLEGVFFNKALLDSEKELK